MNHHPSSASASDFSRPRHLGTPEAGTSRHLRSPSTTSASAAVLASDIRARRPLSATEPIRRQYWELFTSLQVAAFSVGDATFAVDPTSIGTVTAASRQLDPHDDHLAIDLATVFGWPPTPPAQMHRLTVRDTAGESVAVFGIGSGVTIVPVPVSCVRAMPPMLRGTLGAPELFGLLVGVPGLPEITILTDLVALADRVVEWPA